MVFLLSCVPLVLFKELFCSVMVRRSSILGEKAGAFFGGGGECLYIDGGPDIMANARAFSDRILSASLLEGYDCVDGRGPCSSRSVSCNFFLDVCFWKLNSQHFVSAVSWH
jgi:hypothetical protein